MGLILEGICEHGQTSWLGLIIHRRRGCLEALRPSPRARAKSRTGRQLAGADEKPPAFAAEPVFMTQIILLTTRCDAHWLNTGVLLALEDPDGSDNRFTAIGRIDDAGLHRWSHVTVYAGWAFLSFPPHIHQSSRLPILPRKASEYANMTGIRVWSTKLSVSTLGTESHRKATPLDIADIQGLVEAARDERYVAWTSDLIAAEPTTYSTSRLTPQRGC
ncbi:hypothetical protein FJTKL_13854 [Diaporthe vaccinii]|uniref:Uncharacterized protein n=1 Tax=Diaporthe vaccinii TaxID=105482 RepID=A0ABR4F9I7_9PEZI